MRPRPMVITQVTFQNSTQVPLVEHDHVVQAFSANTSDNPFRITVLPRTPGRYRNLSDTQSIHSCCEIMTRFRHDLVPSSAARCRRETLPPSAGPSKQPSGFP